MKSWISFLLPDDEYKEKRMLYFFSEGAIILFLSVIIMIICNRIFTINDVEIVLLLFVAIFLLYVSGRYIISGIEYTDIATEHSYKKEIKNIFSRTCSFVVIFMLLYLIFLDIPSNRNEWMEIIGLLLSVGIVWFITSFISLRRSYKKNKELL
ncbi:DUF3278 domain-containing protein [Oceanobacillus caeni]|uniref:DUF3278 domain-containing protein n=1 Tax=Bacillaceae TaxID=186817 RepID=UPI0011A97E5F|nr:MULTISPECIES: DUF3278 domain-containing protein [Bacillaceae]MCR1832784.1 DUF3278 domain-containing protein [Oceanobacillus caeni]